ncbi:hypothetical protein [Methanoculleus chikugoensis]|uniref:hypothetical protein n=1 Tax=Methanoculleus chikugoensis TaxID=118126 RepID=UPI001FB46F3E|nr:hypothetical protein [Methanoculleus chikugoensis]
MVEGHVKVFEPFQFSRKRETAVVCSAGEVGGEVEAEPGDPGARKRREFSGGVPEEGVAGVDGGEVLEDEAGGIGVAVEEPGELFNGGELPPGSYRPAWRTIVSAPRASAASYVRFISSSICASIIAGGRSS